MFRIEKYFQTYKFFLRIIIWSENLTMPHCSKVLKFKVKIVLLSYQLNAL